MATALMIAVGVLALVVFMLFAVVIELFRDVRQLREVSGILDRPLVVNLGDAVNSRPSAHGLPRAWDAISAGVVLFLSDRCATCHALAAGFSGGLPVGLWVVLEARSPKATEEFLAAYTLTPATTDGRLVVDVAGTIAEHIGLRTTPVGFRVENGRLSGATTVPSRRYLTSILPSPIRLERSVASARKQEMQP